MTFFDINRTLARHLATGGGAAFLLRSNAQKDLSNAVSDLFDARTDVRRLERAQRASQKILQVNDFADMMELRNIVAQQELRRLINYAKQKDHTAHTTYLYLLGIWFFDHITDVHEAIVKASGATTEEEVCEWFLFQWMHASLLHDIGYAFYDLSEGTRVDRERIDGIYSWTWLVALLGPGRGENGTVLGREVKPENLKLLRDVHDQWIKKYGKEMPAPTAKYAPGTYVQVLDRLASAPWLGDLHSDWKDKDIFDILDLDASDTLRTYAMHVANEGYKNDKGQCVDHAVGSGLLLFQYVSYWYWLMNELRPNTTAYEDISGGFNYTVEQLRSCTVPACRAVAYHNFQPSVPGAVDVLTQITLENHPLLYLAIVCDELQRWDRYPAGDAVLQEYERTAVEWPEGDEIELSCTGTDKKVARFCISHLQQEVVVDDLRTTLAKLTGVERIVSIVGHVEE